MWVSLRKVKARNAPTCQECGHFFDPSDGRCLNRGQHSVCPACMLPSRGAEGWAVVNDCQGVFTEAVFSRESESIAAAKSHPYGSAECRSEPVRIIADPDPFLRRMQEAERLFVGHGAHAG